MITPISRSYLSLAPSTTPIPLAARSLERDVGRFWRSRRGATFRAAWLHDTGELYLVQHALDGRGGGMVHLLPPTMGESELERRLAGWPDVSDREGSLEWLLARVRGRTPARRPSRAGLPGRAAG